MTENNGNCKTENWLCRKYNDFVNDKIETKFVYASLFIILLVFHFFAYKKNCDDVFFSEALNNKSLFDYLKYRYFTWSSRILIEAFLPFFTKNYIIWYFIDSAITMLAISSIKKICDIKTNLATVFVFSLFLCLPQPIFDSAGWIATSTNYFWVLSFGLYSFCFIVKNLRKEKIKWFEYLLLVLASLYSINQEQMCVLFFIFFGFFFIYTWIKNKRPVFFILFIFLLSIGALFFILTTPGNNTRSVSEISSWFPEFSSYTIYQKIGIGYFSTLYEFFIDSNFYIFLSSFLMLLLCVNERNNKKLFLVISFITINLFFHCYYDRYYGSGRGTFCFYNQINEIFDFFIKQPNINNKFSLVAILLISFNFLLFLLCAIMCFVEKEKRLFILLVFISGFLSRMLLSFSPTVLASGTRTFIFFYTSFIIFETLLFKKILKSSYAIFLNYLVFLNCIYVFFTFLIRL